MDALMLARTARALYLSIMSSMFNILIPTALLVVLATLVAGIYALFRGGEFGRSWSNRMMRLRVVAQFAAVLVLIAALWWKQSVAG